MYHISSEVVAIQLHDMDCKELYWSIIYMDYYRDILYLLERESKNISRPP